jgi:hypothetical protein
MEKLELSQTITLVSGSPYGQACFTTPWPATLTNITCSCQIRLLAIKTANMLVALNEKDESFEQYQSYCTPKLLPLPPDVVVSFDVEPGLIKTIPECILAIDIECLHKSVDVHASFTRLEKKVTDSHLLLSGAGSAGRETLGAFTRGMMIAAGTKEIIVKSEKCEYMDTLTDSWDDLAPDVQEYWKQFSECIMTVVSSNAWKESVFSSTISVLAGQQPIANSQYPPCPTSKI